MPIVHATSLYVYKIVAFLATYIMLSLSCDNVNYQLHFHNLSPVATWDNNVSDMHSPGTVGLFAYCCMNLNFFNILFSPTI